MFIIVYLSQQAPFTFLQFFFTFHWFNFYNFLSPIHALPLDILFFFLIRYFFTIISQLPFQISLSSYPTFKLRLFFAHFLEFFLTNSFTTYWFALDFHYYFKPRPQISSKTSVLFIHKPPDSLLFNFPLTSSKICNFPIQLSFYPNYFP